MAPIDPAESDQNHIRVISTYATGWRLTGDYDQRPLPLGKLDEFYGNFQVQLPQVIHQSSHTAESIVFAPTADDTDRPGANTPVSTQTAVEVEIIRAESWLFVLPSDQVVAALDLHVRSNLDTDSLPII